jgi:S-adenosylmethionine uptake transporter
VWARVSESPPPSAASDPQSAMVLMVIALLLLPGIDAIAKHLSDSVSAGQVTWTRFMLQSVFLLPLVMRLPGKLLQPPIGLHAVRGALLALTTVLFFYALKFLPIADAISIFFVEPLILTVLSAVFLGEAIGWRRVSAVIVGLVGALIVIRPAFADIGFPAVLPLAAGACFATYLLLTRKLVAHTEPVRMQLYAGVSGAVVMSGALLFGDALNLEAITISSPTLFQWGMLLVLGIIATIGHLMITHAFQRAPAGLLAPLQYVEIVGATILGFLVFGDLPDAATWLGIAIIVCAGLYVFHRERVPLSK